MSDSHDSSLDLHAHTEEEIKKHLRSYVIVFVALLALTVVTVLASYLELSTVAAWGLGLAIASVKGSLVCAWFMHLLGEKQLIIWTLVVTVFMFLLVLLIPYLTDLGNVLI